MIREIIVEYGILLDKFRRIISVTFLYIYFGAMIFALLAHARACVRFVPVSMRLEMSTLDTASIIYVDSHEKESRSFPNAERDCCTCIDSDLEATRKNKSPFEGVSTQREDRVPCCAGEPAWTDV